MDQMSSIKVNKLNCPIIQSDMALKVNNFTGQFDSFIYYFLLVYSKLIRH
jgi:transcription initiation factor TFIIH subunit 1